MPLFQDTHEGLIMPAEALDALREGKEQEQADEFGVIQRELFHAPDGHVTCILEGPDKEAVRKHHEALGIPCGKVHAVTRL